MNRLLIWIAVLGLAACGNNGASNPDPALEQRVNRLEARVAKLEATTSKSTGTGASPSVQPSGVERKQPPGFTHPSEPTSSLEIVDVNSRITEDNNSWSRFAWILEISNRDSKSHQFDAKIKFLDEDGFVVDTDNAYGLVISAGETRQFQGDALIGHPQSRNVSQIKAEIESD